MSSSPRDQRPSRDVSPAQQPGQDQDAAGAAKRLGELVHELSNLLDGATRTVGLVLRSHEQATKDNTELGDASRRLSTVKTALEQMSGIVHAAVRDGLPAGARSRRPNRGLTAELTLGEAVRHAAAILEPLAGEHRVSVSVRIDPSLEGHPAGPVYAVVINGLRNAIESLASTAERNRRAEVSCSVDQGSHVVLEIIDNGIGLPAKEPGGRSEVRLFTPGYTTKPGGSGIGLSFCRDLLMQHGGTIKLEPRAQGTGAALRARFPLRSAIKAQSGQPGSGRRDAA